MLAVLNISFSSQQEAWADLLVAAERVYDRQTGDISYQRDLVGNAAGRA